VVDGRVTEGFDWRAYVVGGATRPDAITGLRPEMQSGLAALLAAADAELGPGALKITSAYRSVEKQRELWEAALRRYGSPEAARRWVAPPGRSQHNHGTAVDFAGPGGLLRDANSREARWLAENAARFGLAVPMSWEPWQVELAGARARPAGGAQAAPAAGPAMNAPAAAGANALAAAAPAQTPPPFEMRRSRLDPRAFQQDWNALAAMPVAPIMPMNALARLA
jgi:hypothetical protein